MGKSGGRQWGDSVAAFGEIPWPPSCRTIPVRMTLLAARRTRARAHPIGRRLVELKAVATVLWSIGSGRELWPGMAYPFNGQRARLQTVRALIARFDPDALIETGAFIASTTRFFCGNGVPVYSAEVKPSFLLLSRLRLGWASGARLFRGDSRTMLTRLAETRPFERPLVYLDAHWWSDVPVVSELDILFGTWSELVVIVDDFRVDDDPGYAYDEYNGIALSLENVTIPPDAMTAFPAIESDAETGARRGALYLAKGADATRALTELVDSGLLRRTHTNEDSIL